jgi:hypothetical protein
MEKVQNWLKPCQLRKMDHDDESALARLMFTKSLETPIERACADEAGVGAVR